MFRLVLMILLFSALPSQAKPTGELWTRYCKDNLDEALIIAASGFDDYQGLPLERFSEYSRSVGAQYAVCIDRLIATAESADKRAWTDTARRHFVPQLKWVQNLLNGNVAEIHHQAKIYKARSKAQGENTDAGFLALVLLSWAVAEKYPPAVFDLAQEYFENGNRTSGLAFIYLEKLLEQAYLPAMLDAARRFLKGDGVEKNLGDAYYWIKRADAAHGDVSAIMGKPHERLLEQMSTPEFISLALVIDKYGNLDWTKIKVPDISSTIPPMKSQP